MRIIAIAALATCIAAPAFAGDKQPPARPPSEMTPTEIKAHNAGIDKSHPYFITCRKTEVIGSLARKLRVCRTTEQWKEASAKGNDSTRETLEGFARSGGTNNN
jgi:hypothetical protein